MSLSRGERGGIFAVQVFMFLFKLIKSKIAGFLDTRKDSDFSSGESFRKQKAIYWIITKIFLQIMVDI